MRVELLPQALLEIEEATYWYLERSRRSAEAFLREVDRGLRIIAELPQLWPLFEAGTRRYVLRKFPYSLIYREASETIEVIAVAHHKRKPQYWVDR